jgi:hypothetical protein
MIATRNVYCFKNHYFSAEYRTRTCYLKAYCEVRASLEGRGNMVTPQQNCEVSFNGMWLENFIVPERLAVEVSRKYRRHLIVLRRYTKISRFHNKLIFHQNKGYDNPFLDTGTNHNPYPDGLDPWRTCR